MYSSKQDCHAINRYLFIASNCGHMDEGSGWIEDGVQSLTARQIRYLKDKYNDHLTTYEITSYMYNYILDVTDDQIKNDIHLENIINKSLKKKSNDVLFGFGYNDMFSTKIITDGAHYDPHTQENIHGDDDLTDFDVDGLIEYYDASTIIKAVKKNNVDVVKKTINYMLEVDRDKTKTLLEYICVMLEYVDRNEAYELLIRMMTALNCLTNVFMIGLKNQLLRPMEKYERDTFLILFGGYKECILDRSIDDVIRFTIQLLQERYPNKYMYVDMAHEKYNYIIIKELRIVVYDNKLSMTDKFNLNVVPFNDNFVNFYNKYLDSGFQKINYGGYCDIINKNNDLIRKPYNKLLLDFRKENRGWYTCDDICDDNETNDDETCDN